MASPHVIQLLCRHIHSHLLQCSLFFLLTVFLCRWNHVFADNNKYFHISTLCVRERYLPTYKIIDGAVLTSESEDNLDCAITFQTDSILQRFMLRFERLALDCNDHLYIFDGAHAFGSHKADLSCRSTRADVGTIFTQSNYVTLKYITDQWSQEGNGFKVVITAFKDTTVECRKFRCLNSFCISQHLVCDGVNHCGDNSDETSHAFCLEHNVTDVPSVDKNESSMGRILGLGVSVFIAIVVSIFVICSLCVVGVAICLCRREREQQRPLQSQSQSTPAHPLTAGHPAYPTQPRFPNLPPERLGEKPPPYPGNMYPPAARIAYNVPEESLYYPTK